MFSPEEKTFSPLGVDKARTFLEKAKGQKPLRFQKSSKSGGTRGKMKVMCRGQGSVTEARRPAEGNKGLMEPHMTPHVWHQPLHLNCSRDRRPFLMNKPPIFFLGFTEPLFWPPPHPLSGPRQSPSPIALAPLPSGLIRLRILAKAFSLGLMQSQGACWPGRSLHIAPLEDSSTHTESVALPACHRNCLC